MGLIFALAGLRLLVRLGPETLPRLNEVGTDASVLAFTFMVSVLVGILFGMLPAFRASRVDLNGVLKEGGRTSNASHHRARDLFVIVQVALSLLLLIGAGLLIRSYAQIQNASPGFNPKNVLSFDCHCRIPVQRTSSYEFLQATERKNKGDPGGECRNFLFVAYEFSGLAWGPITIEVAEEFCRLHNVE